MWHLDQKLVQFIAGKPREDSRVLTLIELLALDARFLKVLQEAHSVPLCLEIACLDHDLGDALGSLLCSGPTFQATLD